MANEKRLIDANALLAEYDRVHIGPPGGARKLMENAPTVDAVEVVHGKWETIIGFDFGNCYGHCSNCKTPQKASCVTALYADYRYCPWCGAIMDGGNEDG